MAALTSQTVLSLLTFRNLFLLATAYIFYTWISQLIRYRFLSPLRHFPGPFCASVTRLWIAYHNIKEDECQVELALHKKHGTHLIP
jgi:hypothetical protein